jgi:hypothetical protein
VVIRKLNRNYGIKHMVDSEIKNSSDHCRCAVEVGVLSRPVGSDAVLLDLNSHDYFGLNEVGARIWAALADGCSRAEIVENRS